MADLRKSFRYLSFFTILGVAGCAYGAMAQPVTEVIVHASRFSTYHGDSAFSALDIGRAGLDKATSIDVALKSVVQASLFRRSSSLTANPTVQGVSLRAIGPSGAGRALVTLDGIPQNDPFGNWVIWAALPQEAVDHIHVVRGAGGGAYGAGALTGVIDMTLRPPGGFNGQFDLGEGGNSDLAIGGGYDTGTAGIFGLYYNDRTLNGDVPVHAPQRGAADVATSGRDHSILGDWRASVCPFAVCGEVSALAGHYDSRRDTGLAGATAKASGDQYSLSFTRQSTVTSNGFRVQYWRKASDLSNTSVSVATGRTSTVLANNQVATPATGEGFNTALRHQTPDVEWEIGMDARLNSGEAREYYKYVSGQPTRYRVAGGKTFDLGVYGEATRSIDALTLTGALRVDMWKSSTAHRSEIDLTTGVPALDLHPDDRRITETSARLGAAYALTPALTMRGGVYTGFRPPSLNELYRPFRVGNDVTEANADLRPESLRGAELGVAYKGERFSLDMDVFYNVLKSPISNVTIGQGPGTFPVAGFIPAGGSLRMRKNLGEIKAYGLEMHSRYALSDDLALTGSATLTHARVGAPDQPQLNGKRPAEAPDYSGSLGAEWRHAPFIVSADMLFEGGTFDDDLSTLALKPYNSLNLEADYTLTRRLSLRVQISNALDTAIPITHAGDGTLGYDTGRRLSLGLVYRYDN